MAEQRRPSKFIGFRLPMQEVDELDTLAKRDNRTRNGLIRHVLAKYIQTEQQIEQVERGEVVHEGA